MIIKVQNDTIIGIYNDKDYQEGFDVSVYQIDDSVALDISKPLSEQIDIQKLEALKYLQKTDYYMSRLVEDLIEILISKNIISLDEFNAIAQMKLNKRKDVRNSL